MQSTHTDVKQGRASSVLFSFQQTFILGSQKAWWGLKHSRSARPSPQLRRNRAMGNYTTGLAGLLTYK